MNLPLQSPPLSETDTSICPMPAGRIAALPAPALGAALELVHAHSDEPIQVADLADAAGYSQHHFSRMFAASMGVAPAQYVCAQRIDAAKRMLLDSDFPVIDVATSVGFDSLSSFTRRFRDSVGIPPAQLRRLAGEVASTTLTPFSLGDGDGAAISVRMQFPPGDEITRGPGVPRATWVGWFPRPSPIGLPAEGILTWSDELSLPLCPGNPWLLGFTVATNVDAHEILAPERPLVAIHMQPVFAPSDVTLRFDRAHPFAVPMLPALPSLRTRLA